MNKALISGFASIFLLAPMTIYADQLVTNGGFEIGNLSGWTQLDNSTPYNTEVQMDNPHTGSYYLNLGPSGSDGLLSQTLSTVAGETYQITFWLASDGQTPNDFSATFGNQTLISQSNLASFDWTEFSYTAAATSDSTVLQFGFRDDPGFLSLDDIGVSSICGDPGSTSAAPEPSTWELAGIAGLFGVAFRYCRKRRASYHQYTL